LISRNLLEKHYFERVSFFRKIELGGNFLHVELFWDFLVDVVEKFLDDFLLACFTLTNALL